MEDESKVGYFVFTISLFSSFSSNMPYLPAEELTTGLEMLEVMFIPYWPKVSIEKLTNCEVIDTVSNTQHFQSFFNYHRIVSLLLFLFFHYNCGESNKFCIFCCPLKVFIRWKSRKDPFYWPWKAGWSIPFIFEVVILYLSYEHLRNVKIWGGMI